MDTTSLVLINGFVGTLISQGCEQGAFFQDPAQPPLKKFLFVMTLCVGWSFVYTFLSISALPQTLTDWRTLLISVVASAIGSQAVHVAIGQWLPGLGSFLTRLRTVPAVAVISTTTSTPDGTQTIVATTAPTLTTNGTTPALGTPVVAPK